MGEMKQWWSFLALLLLVILVTEPTAVVALTAAECKLERKLAVKECLPVVFGKFPTPECCVRARVSHTECICPAVTPKVVAFVDVNRAIRLIEGCGRKIPRHFKCGSLTTP